MADHTDLQDWEVLQSPDAIPEPSFPPIALVPNRSDDVIDGGDPTRSVYADYFAVGSDGNYKNYAGKVEEENPSVGEEERAVDLEEKLSDSNGDGGSGVVEVEEEVRLEVDGGVGEVAAKRDASEELGSAEGCDDVVKVEFLGEKGVEKSDSGNLPVGNGGKGEFVWWKLPMEIVKFCVFKVRPVWSISIAAAVMGFIMLGQRWYRMKRRTRALALKVVINNKNASESVARAARLNKAFSPVRVAPLIKTSFPSNGITPWPAMALR